MEDVFDDAPLKEHTKITRSKKREKCFGGKKILELLVGIVIP
jgi:hypothetical protein